MFHSSPFQLALLDQYGATAAVSLRSTGLGVGFTTLGDKLYRETTVSLGAAWRLGNNMDVGLLVNGHELSIRNYGSTRTTALSASLTYTLSPFVRWSLLYRNLNAPKIGTSAELLPQVIATGITLSPTSVMTAAVELERDLDFDARYKFGILWRPVRAFTVVTGFVNHPAQITAAISIQVKRQSSRSYARISYAIANHPHLALSHVVALQFALP